MVFEIEVADLLHDHYTPCFNGGLNIAPSGLDLALKRGRGPVYRHRLGTIKRQRKQQIHRLNLPTWAIKTACDRSYAFPVDIGNVSWRTRTVWLSMKT